MVGLAQMVRASDCGPEGRRFDPDIPPHRKYSILRNTIFSIYLWYLYKKLKNVL